MAPQSGPATAVTSSTSSASATPIRKPAEKKYKCQFCSRAFSRSEHRSRHERSRKLYMSPSPELPPPWGTTHHELWWRSASDIFDQIPKNDPSNVQSVAAPLYDVISFSAMTGRSMPKMVVPLSRLKAESDRVLRPHRSKMIPQKTSMSGRMGT